MKILITGGLGHLGSYLLTYKKFMLQNDITVVDNLSTQRYCTLFSRKYYYNFISKDFNDLENLDKYDVVIHLAAVVDAAASIENKEKVNEVNVEKTINFFNSLKKLENPPLVIFPSSTSVYGESTFFVTETSKVSPQSPYADAKLVVEDYLINNYPNYIIFRFGTIVGYSIGMRFQTAVNKFCFQTSYGEKLTVWKENYNSVRPYLCLEDMAQAVYLGLGLGPASRNIILNVVTENLTTKQIIDFIDKNPNINFINTPLLNQFSYIVDSSAISNLGFSPTGNVETDIIKTLKKLR